jgi:TetR/AcrR family transcriptional repressor of nem operon
VIAEIALAWVFAGPVSSTPPDTGCFTAHADAYGQARSYLAPGIRLKIQWKLLRAMRTVPATKCMTSIMHFQHDDYHAERQALSSKDFAVGHSQADKARNRERILEVAATQLRELGLDGVSISDLMKAVDLTHGGFYGHFASRDDLVAAALDKALTDGEASAIKSGSAKGKRTLKSVANSYLSKVHRDNPDSGCALSALSGDVARSNNQNREIMSKHLARYFDNIQEVIGDNGSKELAISLMCMMVGAVTLSRVMTDPDRSDEILQAARKSMLQLGDEKQ